MTTPTAEQISAALKVMIAISDAIKELGSVPSGKLYASVMSVISLNQFNSIIGQLVDMGVVRNNSDVLTWID